MIDSYPIQQVKHFTKKTESLLNMFVFFLAFPTLSILGNSITFYIFISMILSAGIKKSKYHKGKYLFLAFFFIGFIASIFTPVYDRHPGFLSSVLIMIQFFYWISIASFIIINYSKLSLINLSKWMFIGSVIYILVFFFLPVNFKSYLISLEFEPGRNAIVFNLLCSIPLSFYYIYHRWNKKGVFIALVFFLLSMLATNGRAGAIILIIESLLIIGIFSIKIQKNIRVVLALMILLFFMSQSESNQQRIHAFSYEVDRINPRLGDLLRTNEDGNLKRDKSWQQRKLMVSKGKEIFEKYPFIGIGPNNFKYYDSELSEYSAFDYLQGNSKELYNRRSAHNSYIQILTEFGIFGLVVFLLIIAHPIFLFLKTFNKAKLKPKHLPMISLIGISIHFYAISAFTGAIPWLIIGLSWALINERKKKTI